VPQAAPVIVWLFCPRNAKVTVLSVDPDTIVGGEPLRPGTYEVIVTIAIKRDTILPLKEILFCHISMRMYYTLAMLSQGPLHGHLAR
jgi:hypothetical protein